MLFKKHLDEVFLKSYILSWNIKNNIHSTILYLYVKLCLSSKHVHYF